MLEENLDSLVTEKVGHWRHIDQRPIDEVLRIINYEDHQVAPAVRQAIPQIAKAVELVVERLRRGGRLLYVGAGTSGRLGVLDAAECPPTFGVGTDLVSAVIAGGDTALTQAVEEVEDSPEQGAEDLKARQVSSADAVVGIAASGRTPYVIGALKWARQVGAATISLVNNSGTPLGELGDVEIAVVVGPEVVAGSTRMKAGTAQKMVLNMISTTVMIRLGKVYDNLMVDVRPTNSKLANRAARIVAQAAGCDLNTARQALRCSGGNPKTAIVMVRAGVDRQEAEKLLEMADGSVGRALSM